MVTIRAYTDADYEDVRRNFESGGVFDPIWDTRQHLADKITRAPESILVAEVKGRVMGNIFTTTDGWGAFIFRLVVHADARRQGIGGQLMDAAENLLRRRGIPEVAFFVDNSNEELKAWYVKRGALPSGTYECMYTVLRPKR